MSPIKNELLLNLSLGLKQFSVGDLKIDLIYGFTTGKIPEEIRPDVENIMKRARRNSALRVESKRQTRRRVNEMRKKKQKRGTRI